MLPLQLRRRRKRKEELTPITIPAQVEALARYDEEPSSRIL